MGYNVYNEADMEMLRALRDNKYIKEHDCGNGISSFNFSQKAFYHNVWTDIVCKARGLFLDNKTGKVRMRSFDKFWDLEDHRFPETSLSYLRDGHVEYPVEAFVKYNGYLSMASAFPGYDSYKLLTASKSRIDNWYANNFHELLMDAMDNDADRILEFSRFCCENDVTCVFETIDPVNDSHIIPYHERHIVLLDVIVNDSYLFMPWNYISLKKVGNRFGFEVKDRIAVLDDWDQLERFIFDHRGDPTVEGYVLRDNADTMWKLHSSLYAYKKRIRGIIGQLHTGKAPDEIKNYHQKIGNPTIEEYLPAIVHGYELRHDGECPNFLDVWPEIAPMM